MSKCSLQDINSYCGRKRKKKPSAFFHMFCKETVQMDYLLVWSFLLLQLAQIQVALDLPDTHIHTQTRTHPCAHTPPVWSTTDYYWLTCLNSASSKSHSNSFSILHSYESWMVCRSFFLAYLTFLAVTEICLSPSYLLPEKPCWLVFSHFTLGFIPLTPNAQRGWAAWPLESWMLDSSASQGPELGFILPGDCKRGREQTFLNQTWKKIHWHSLWTHLSCFCCRFQYCLLSAFGFEHLHQQNFIVLISLAVSSIWRLSIQT